MDSKKLKKLKKIIKDFQIFSKEETIPSFIKTKAYNFTLNNGFKLSREKIIKGNKDGSAVIIIPYINDNLLLVIEPRVFTKTGVGISFPAGYIEEGEKPVEAALRELKEETGLVPEKLVEVDSFYQDEGCSEAFNHIFIAYNCKRVSKQNLDKDEYIEYMEFTLDEVLELEDKGLINSANTKLALSKIKRR